MKLARVIPVAFAPASKRQKHGVGAHGFEGMTLVRKKKPHVVCSQLDQLNGYVLCP